MAEPTSNDTSLAMAQPTCNNMFATAFMVGFALPIPTCPRRMPLPSPPHRLDLRRTVFAKEKSKRMARFRTVNKRSGHGLVLLAGLLEPDQVHFSLHDKKALLWKLRIHKTIMYKPACRRALHVICKICTSLTFETGVMPAATSSIVASAQTDKIDEKKGFVGHQNSSTNAANSHHFQLKGTPPRSPDEIQTYMKMKNQLRIKERRAAIAQANAAMVARKEKMKSLEIERRARLRVEALSTKGRVDALPRPQWDSSISMLATEANGPWSSLPDSAEVVDFPLPKRIDADGFSSLGLASKSSFESILDSREMTYNEDSVGDDYISSEGLWWHSESAPGKDSQGDSHHHRANLSKKIFCQQGLQNSKLVVATSNHKICSGGTKDSSSMHYRKELSMVSSAIRKRATSNMQHKGLFAKQSWCPVDPKLVNESSKQHTLFQRAYDSESTVSYQDELRPIRLLRTKPKTLMHIVPDSSSKAFERRLRPPAKTKKQTGKRQCLRSDYLFCAASRQQQAFSPHDTPGQDDMRDMACGHARYVTYHLEKFPANYEREALTESKRVALLKFTAQQLVKRLDASQACPARLLDDKVQAHALLLRSNLEKFHRELETAVKALEERCLQACRQKTSGYIILPRKFDRNCSSQRTLKDQRGSQEVLGLLQIKDALSQQAARVYPDLNSQTAASFTSASYDSLPERATTRMRFLSPPDKRETDSPESSLVWEREATKSKTPDSISQDFESKLQSSRMDFKSGAIMCGKHTYDHDTLDKELEKLDAEIKETKARMARNLFSTHPSLVERCMGISSLSSSPLYSDNAASSLTEGNLSCRGTVVDVSKEDTLVLGQPHGAKDEVVEKNLDRDFRDLSLGDKVIHNDDKDPVRDMVMEFERVDKNSAQYLIDFAGQPDVQQRHLHGAAATIYQSPSWNDAKIASLTPILDSMRMHPHVRSVEVTQVIPEQDSAGGLLVPFRKQIQGDTEGVADYITKELMHELVESQLSDVLRLCKALSYSSHAKINKVDSEEPAKLERSSLSDLRSDDAQLQLCADKLGSAHVQLCSSPEGLCLTGSSAELNESDHPDGHHDYRDFMPARGDDTWGNESSEINRESFKLISQRLVEKYANEALEARGLLSSSSLLQLYASGKTLSTIVPGQTLLEDAAQEEQLYGKMLLEALCECLDKTFLHFCVPSFFVFQQPCPEGPRLKQTLISKVNEHADAACEGGFSLEHILEKSLDEEDWKTPYQEMMEVIHDMSEHVMNDIMDSFVCELMGLTSFGCPSPVSSGFLPSIARDTHCC